MEEVKSKDKYIGKITHYFDKIGVAVVELTDDISVGDTIRIQGSKTDFEQSITSMQVDHQEVAVAFGGDSIGLKANEAVHENDVVYKLLKE